jgi:hypothetical protein
MIPIPFSLPDDGLRERQGTVTIEEGELVLRIHDRLLGLIDADRVVVRIAPEALAHVVIRRRPLVDRLVIVPVRGDLLNGLPGGNAGSLELRVWRRHRAALEDLVDEIDAP